MCVSTGNARDINDAQNLDFNKKSGLLIFTDKARGKNYWALEKIFK